MIVPCKCPFTSGFPSQSCLFSRGIHYPTSGRLSQCWWPDTTVISNNSHAYWPKMAGWILILQQPERSEREVVVGDFPLQVSPFTSPAGYVSVRWGRIRTYQNHVLGADYPAVLCYFGVHQSKVLTHIVFSAFPGHLITVDPSLPSLRWDRPVTHWFGDWFQLHSVGIMKIQLSLPPYNLIVLPIYSPSHAFLGKCPRNAMTLKGFSEHMRHWNMAQISSTALIRAGGETSGKPVAVSKTLSEQYSRRHRSGPAVTGRG
jgi:hypothetical protein